MFILASKLMNAQQSPADSVLAIINTIKGHTTTDTITFRNALSTMYNQSWDTTSIQQLNNGIDKARAHLEDDFYYSLKTSVCNLFISIESFYKGIDYSKLLLSQLRNYSNPFQKYLFLQLLAELRVPYRNSDRIQEGIEYYLRLSNTYIEKKDSQVVSECYYVLRGFYGTLGLIDKCIYYQQKSIQYLNPNELLKPDSLANTGSLNLGVLGIINRKSVLASIYIENGKPELGLPLLYEAKTVYEKYKDSIFIGDGGFLFLQILRAKIILNDDSVDYYQTITESLVGNDSIYDAHLKLTKGYNFYLHNNLDSAMHYMQQSQREQNSLHISTQTFAGVLMPGYYISLVNIKLKKYAEAIFALPIEIEKLKKSNLRKEAAKEMELLATVYKLAGDYKNSMLTLEQYNQLTSELKYDEEKNRNISFELEQSIAEKEKQMDVLSVENSYSRKRSYYLAGIALLIAFIAAGVYNRYRSKQKSHTLLEEKNKLITFEKERSEELLLNILPAETAEELKNTGAAKARSFNEVTVMFTDFKNFTKASETLSAAELVHEINHLYSEFDQIISKYNIEKIKTIGDSYMAAAGLPVENITNASDTILAAIDILNFMSQYRIIKEKEHKPFFEMRIGIHTGPVVAGIVGIKKFAYDIWGDTVNIASRMESSGEAGRINISGATFEHVKEKFTCTYRGKIDAKNKGEIDMYFVENLNKS